MKISAISVKDFKRVRDIAVKPGDDATLVVIGGKNRQGKSSLLDALTAAFGGKRAAPAEPIRNGAKSAEIRVELDGGAFRIARKFTASGQTVEVHDDDGKIRSPQKRLDELVGARMLDPLAFLRASPKEQRAELLRCVDLGIDLDGWEREHRELFDQRTEVGRDRKRLEAELAGLPEPAAAERVDVAADLSELSRIDRQLSEHARRGDEIQRIDEEGKRTKARIDELAAELARLRGRIGELKEERTSAKAARDAIDADALRVKREEIAARVSETEERNREAAKAEAQADRRREVAAKLEQATTVHGKLEGEIAEHRATRDRALEAAEMPVTGLDVTAEGVTYGGVPLEQASGAEQLRVSLSIAMAMSPHVHDIWVKDGALLDEDSLEALRQLAEDRGYRVWIERVGDGDDGALVIEDGALVESSAA